MYDRITDTMKIGEIVAKYPYTSEILQAFHIDFCCGGNRPLHEAITEKDLSVDIVMSKLNEAHEKAQRSISEQVDWNETSFQQLIDYIVNHHHAYLNNELPQLSKLVTTVLRVHGTHHHELTQIHQKFHTLKMDMEQHMIKEEMDTFPMIREFEQDPTTEKLTRTIQMIEILEQEHDVAGELLKQIRDVTHDFTLPEDACATFSLTYEKLQELESDMFQHVHLENNILFPRLQNEFQQRAI